MDPGAPLGEATRSRDLGGVKQNVGRLAFGLEAADEAAHLLGPRKIDGDGARPVSARQGERTLAPVVECEHDLDAAAGERLDDRAADGAAAAEHEGAPPGRGRRHASSSR